jgi:hypothetical protein
MSAAEYGSEVGCLAQELGAVGAVGGTEVVVGPAGELGSVCPAVDEVPPLVDFGEETDEPLSSRSASRGGQPLSDRVG